MQHFVRTSGEQRPGQWAVRCTGLLCFLLLIASVPVLHLGWMLVRGPGTHAIRTRAQVDAPALEWNAVEDGTWMKRLERHLQEESPVVWEMRGSYNETRYVLGLLQNDDVYIGKDGWMFLRGFRHLDGAAIARASEQRRQKLQRLRERAERLGVAIVALPLPDKARIYPEFAFPGGMPPGLQQVYGTLLADLAAAGIPAVDAGAVLLAARADPATPLFHLRDTHWNLAGCMAVAQTLATYLKQGPLADRLGPQVPLTLTAPMKIEVIPDLVSLLGLRTWVAPGPPGHTSGIVRPGSLVSARLTETKEYWKAGRGEAAASYEPTIAVAGSSFSVENGYEAFGWFLSRPVDHQDVWPGAQPWESIERVLGRMERGECRARIVVWEFLERTYGDAAWTSP